MFMIGKIQEKSKHTFHLVLTNLVLGEFVEQSKLLPLTIIFFHSYDLNT